MRTVAIGIALLTLAAAEPALSPSAAAHASSFTCCDRGRNVHVSERHDPSDARIAITTQSGKVTLLLTDRDVLFQLSDRTFHKVQRELRDAKDKERDNWFANAIVTAVTGTVGEVLDHSLVCHVRDLRDVTYDDGRLVFIGRNGRSVFGHTHGGNSDAENAFSEHDAQNFVREFRRLKGLQ
jgi:hypothetical protein